jgi:predicted NUDIX family phosphoesterase
VSREPERTDPLARGADEMIWGIPRATAFPHGAWRGFRAFASREEGEAEIGRLEGAAQVRSRRELEMDPEWKQPIPYAIAIFRDATNHAFLFWMDRLEGTSDRRLHGRASFGVGGHIGAADTGIESALTREWSEEVATPALPSFTPLGLLNDDGDDVGRVHLGVVYLARLASPEIQVREREKLAGALVPLEEAVARAGELEGWSAALISHIEALAT